MNAYEQNLHIEDDAFGSMRSAADSVLQKLLKNMTDNGSTEGSVTIKIDISLTAKNIPNRDPNVPGDTRKIFIPVFAHKVTSMLQIKSEAKGISKYEDMEMVWDETAGEFVLKPIANTDQMTIFDADFRCVNDDEDTPEESTVPMLETNAALLPELADEEPDHFDDYDY